MGRVAVPDVAMLEGMHGKTADNARRDERAVTHRATQKWGVVPPKFASRVCYWPKRIVSAVED